MRSRANHGSRRPERAARVTAGAPPTPAAIAATGRKDRTTATDSRLRPQQARRIGAAERAYDDAKRTLGDRRREREEIRARYKDLIPLGELIEVGGIKIKRILKTSGQHFRLKAFLNRHKLTKAMTPFVSEPTEYEDWQVQEAKK